MSSYLTGDPLTRPGVERIYRTVVGANPAAGQEHDIVVPGGKLWFLLSALTTLVADATVANRVVRLTYDDGNTEYARVHPPSQQTASLTYVYSWAAGLDRVAAVAASLGVQAGLPAIPLFPGHHIRTVTRDLQAGDDFGPLTLYVCEVELRGLDSQQAYELADEQ